MSISLKCLSPTRGCSQVPAVLVMELVVKVRESDPASVQLQHHAGGGFLLHRDSPNYTHHPNYTSYKPAGAAQVNRQHSTLNQYHDGNSKKEKYS